MRDFKFAARNVAATFGVLLTVFVVLPPYAVYKDYKFTKIRSEPVYFKGEIFAMRLSALVFWALFSTRFFAVFKYGAHVGIPCALFCHIKNSKEHKFD